MNAQIDKLNRHVIVCGFGRIGVALAAELRAGGAVSCILERDERHAAPGSASGLFVCARRRDRRGGVARAGVLRARTLATVLPNDAANVFITLRARGLNETLEIIARGELPSRPRTMLLQAGANNVILPTHIGAERIAEMIFVQGNRAVPAGSPYVKDFETALHQIGLELEMIEAAPDSKLVGKTIESIEQQAGGGILIVQVHRRGGGAITNPERRPWSNRDGRADRRPAARKPGP